MSDSATLIRATLHPFNCFFDRVDFPDPVSCDQLLSGRTIDNVLAPENLTRLALEEGCSPSPANIMPGINQLFVKLHHVTQQLLARHYARFRFSVALTMTITRISILL